MSYMVSRATDDVVVSLVGGVFAMSCYCGLQSFLYRKARSAGVGNVQLRAMVRTSLILGVSVAISVALPIFFALLKL